MMIGRQVKSNELSLEESINETNSRSSLRSIYADCRAPWFSLALNFSCTLLFGFAIYFQNYDPQAIKIFKLAPPGLQAFGLWKFLTYHSLVMQFVSAVLHLVAHKNPKYRMLRDIVFNCLAYPIGSMVVYIFWTIWFTQGRELIFPKYIEPYYPVWLNHVTHTIMLPINIAQAYLTFHRFIKKGYFVPLVHICSYSFFLLYLRWKSGLFVYPFMNAMGLVALIIYHGTLIFLSVALYETTYFITSIFHLEKMKRLTERNVE